MGRWFRFYDDAINDPKILKLPEASRWHWLALLCVASKNDGVLPATDDVALMLRIKPSAAAAILAQMKMAGLLDYVDGVFSPHNWNGRQYKSDVSTERVKRFRNGQRNVSETLQKRPQSTEADTDNRTEQKDTREVALSSAPSDFDLFWSEWPNKVGKPAAEKAFRSAIKRATFDAIWTGLLAYIRNKPLDRPWLNPATFLNQNRWEDQPAPTAKPLTEHQHRRLETQDILDDLDKFSRNRSAGGEANPGVLPGDSCGEPESIRGGTGGNLIELSPSRVATRG